MREREKERASQKAKTVERDSSRQGWGDEGTGQGWGGMGRVRPALGKPGFVATGKKKVLFVIKNLEQQ